MCLAPPNLIQYSARLPGSRILDERFGVNRVGIVVPKGDGGRLAYFSEFVESAKALALSSALLSALDYAVPGAPLQTRAPHS